MELLVNDDDLDQCSCGSRGLNNPDPPYHCATCHRVYLTLRGFDDHRHAGTRLAVKVRPRARQRPGTGRAAVTVKSVRLDA